MKPIQTDIYTFEDLRTSAALYVDKTEYVHRLVSSVTKSYFLSRPRRFGKSLLISTLKAYFMGKRHLFEGLRLADLQPGEWETYPVIHLDMANGSSRDSMETTKEKMRQVVVSAAEECGVEIEETLPQIMLKKLTERLHAKTGKPVVVLVDEYDKPILDALHTDWAEKAIDLCQEFYQNLKSNLEIERFVFITGVTKFAHTSIFSGFNNPTDITRDAEYARMLGYTREEVEDNFAEHIERTAPLLNLDRDELLAKLKYWYDGHRFTIDPVTLYNPVSVGQFFIKKSFLNFWVETGTPSFLVNEMKNHAFELEKYIGRWQSLDEFGKYDIHDLNPMSLAIQTGYLTISDARLNEDSVHEVRYDYPNNEIRMSWSKEMMRLAFYDRNEVINENQRLRNDISTGNCQDMMECLKGIFAGASYENIGRVQVNEGYYRNMLYMLFSAFNIHRGVEEHTSAGRVDVVASDKRNAYVFELKTSASDKEVKERIAEALRQAEEGHYGDRYRAESAHVHVIAAVFDKRTHMLVDWEIRD